MASTSAAPTYQSGNVSIAPAHSGAATGTRAAALDFLKQLAAELSSGTVDLPCFPDIVLRVRRVLDEPHNTAERTVTIVGAEPRLAARLLQTANSAAYNTTGKPVTELRSAVTRLGTQMVQSATMAFAVQHMKDEESLRPILRPLTDLWRRSISVAVLCQVLAGRTKLVPDEAFLTGLLHGIGSLYIMVRAVTRSRDIEGHDAFLELVSGWQASIGKAVLENWGFAAPMCNAIAEQREHDRRRRHEADLSDVLIVALVLCDGLLDPAAPAIEVNGIPSFATLGLTNGICAEVLAEAHGRVGSLQSALGVTPTDVEANAERTYPPGDAGVNAGRTL